jgi:hypothetical protein
MLMTLVLFCLIAAPVTHTQLSHSYPQLCVRGSYSLAPTKATQPSAIGFSSMVLRNNVLYLE